MKLQRAFASISKFTMERVSTRNIQAEVESPQQSGVLVVSLVFSLADGLVAVLSFVEVVEGEIEEYSRLQPPWQPLVQTVGQRDQKRCTLSENLHPVPCVGLCLIVPWFQAFCLLVGTVRHQEVLLLSWLLCERDTGEEEEEGHSDGRRKDGAI